MSFTKEGQYRDLANSELLRNRKSENRFKLGGSQSFQLCVYERTKGFFFKKRPFFLLVGNTALGTTFP